MRIDLHVHSKYSFDAINKPSDVYQKVREGTVDGIALTDHNVTSGWKEFAGFAQKKGFLLIQGEEILIIENGKRIGELLGFFMQEPIRPGPLDGVVEKLQAQDALISVPHPYGWLTVPDKILSVAVEKHFCVEQFNSRNFFQFMNKKARSFIQKHRLPFTAGSDAHAPWEIGNAFVESTATGLEAFRKDIEKRKVMVKGRGGPWSTRLLGPLIKAKWIK